MIAIIFTSYVKKENQDAFLIPAKRHADLSKKDVGCIRFDVLSPEGEEVKFIEIWESQACLDAHAKRSAAGKEAPEMNALRYDKKMEKYEII